jgi:protein phosphatase 1G
MGAYLSQPITDKETFEGESSVVAFGGSSMQGWRRTMEDAHLAEAALPSDPNTAIFGVFDGHGGAEVAKFCQRYMGDEFARLKQPSDETIEEALVKVFHRMDEMLRDNKCVGGGRISKTAWPLPSATGRVACSKSTRGSPSSLSHPASASARPPV